ncbi:MvaI/BcnI family restriction endonuclease [Sedimentisphaera salicampi]|uniref:MvaI/BcnI restriction endonuclease domain-containing protein n=1 Tax=Sedimentisphaera salicampi TaxID=1941349 RepID=A0A1W6LKW3_9BACT|nr:MvaI/BcnI family restriction endonuclease [Sedimentisphaera salicampi]ARN56364.1 hypothetical protein STSP1_00745 [Sedimentisphaera salicampi]
MKLEEFTEKFQELRDKQYVRSLRKGPTGIGYTFETMMGIDENNFALSDIPQAEIKTHRQNSQSMITLFTFNNKAWQIPPLEAIKKYGSEDSNGRLGIYFTMKLKPNSQGLFLHLTETDISVRHISGEIVAVWQIDSLVKRFKEKIPALIFVSAFTEQRGDIEYFHFYRAQLLEQITHANLLNQFKEENVFVDLRLHDKGTRARNHGTAFRVYEHKLPLIFGKRRDL